MKVTVTVTLHDFLCTTCKRKTTVEVLAARNGSCQCGGGSFDFQITSIKKSFDGPDQGEAAMRLVAGMMVGGFAGAGLINSAQGESCTENRSYGFNNVSGNLIMQLLQFDPEQVLHWVSAVRKEQAKANLRADQGLCIVCDELYTRSMGGPSSLGFCSRICSDRHARAQGPAVNANEPKAQAQKVTCPKCTRPVKVKIVSGVSSYKCMWCGGAIEIGSGAQ